LQDKAEEPLAAAALLLRHVDAEREGEICMSTAIRALVRTPMLRRGGWTLTRTMSQKWYYDWRYGGCRLLRDCRVGDVLKRVYSHLGPEAGR
jgi:hypothetical protein